MENVLKNENMEIQKPKLVGTLHADELKVAKAFGGKIYEDHLGGSKVGTLSSSSFGWSSSEGKSLPPAKSAKREYTFLFHGENGESSGTQSQQHHVTIDELTELMIGNTGIDYYIGIDDYIGNTGRLIGNPELKSSESKRLRTREEPVTEGLTGEIPSIGSHNTESKFQHDFNSQQPSSSGSMPSSSNKGNTNNELDWIDDYNAGRLIAKELKSSERKRLRTREEPGKSLPPAKSAKRAYTFLIHGENGESSGTQSQQHHVTIDELHAPEPSAISQIIAPEAAERAIANVNCDPKTLLSEADEVVTIERSAESEYIVVPTTKMCVLGCFRWTATVVIRLLNTKHRVAIVRPKFVGDSKAHRRQWRLIYKHMKKLGVKTLETISDAVNAADIIFVDDTPMSHLHASQIYELLSFMTKGKQVVDLTTYEDVDAAAKVNSEFRAKGACYLGFRLIGDSCKLRGGTTLALADGDDEVFKATESFRAVVCSECIKFGKPGHAVKYAAIIQCLKGALAASLSEASEFIARLPYKSEACGLDDDQNENSPPQVVLSYLLNYTAMSSKFMTSREKNTVEASGEQLLQPLDCNVPKQAIGAVLKDMKFVQSMAEKSSSSTPVIHAAKEVFTHSIPVGLENDDLWQVDKRLCKCKSPQEDEET